MDVFLLHAWGGVLRVTVVKMKRDDFTTYLHLDGLQLTHMTELWT